MSEVKGGETFDCFMGGEWICNVEAKTKAAAEQYLHDIVHATVECN